MKKLITICLVCVLSTASIVLADDVFPPEWRGELGTVRAEWDTWTGFAGPMYPDWCIINPDTIQYPSAYAYDGTSLLSMYQGRPKVLELTGDDQIKFHMPNFDQENPYKDIQIQITYYPVDGSQYSCVDVSAGSGYDISDPVFIRSDYRGSGWWLDVWTLRIEPNPPSEYIFVNFFNMYGGGAPLYPAYVDQVVIDTICVPEPATVALLGLGALSLIRRKR